MSKIKLDKYYTPVSLAKYCIDKTYSVIGKDCIAEIIEPSAGNGSFSLQIPDCIAYDIEPDHDSITRQDFMALNMSYKKGRLFIGNPPFGSRNNLALQFYKKCIGLADYVSFILPVSQYNNTNSMFEFDLVYSEILKEQEYSNVLVPCCLNIYKRPQGGLNMKPVWKLEDVTILSHRRSETSNLSDCDLRICGFGNSIGKTAFKADTYVLEFLFIINNLKLKDQILSLITTAKWKEIYPMTKSPSLLKWQIIKYLKEQIPEIK